MNVFSPPKFTTTIQKEILKRFIEIESCIISFQTIFSVPSLLMFTAHFSCCSAVLGLVVTGTFLNMPGIYIIYHTTSILNSLSFLMACMWFAGGVSRRWTTSRQHSPGRLNKVCCWRHESENLCSGEVCTKGRALCFPVVGFCTLPGIQCW
ncbi:hypothetical protein JTE90_025583 [Oedothorax gibbosus]|uniref:Uncharacterized protein n=1 Tax=Oedothorax gibbosus TaxID=931172 RepID=A0AAV6U3M0_9ARAC|nr:hypothetical protein JTE90_025583 [Oedothorax gibbosus]